MHSFLAIAFLSIARASPVRQEAKHATTSPVPHFGYESAEGAEFWASISPEWKTCSAGKEQSPINIETASGHTIAKPPIHGWKGCKFTGNFTNNGHSVVITLPEYKQLNLSTKEDETFRLAQFHFHSPSEHHLDGHFFDLEAHFVHKSATGKLAVFGVFFNVGAKPSPFLHSILDQGVPTKDKQVTVKSVDIGSLFYDVKSNPVYTYDGSLTTPPCTEGVSWFVSSKPLTISSEQRTLIQSVMGYNARPTQPHEDDEVLHEGKYKTGKSKNGSAHKKDIRFAYGAH